MASAGGEREAGGAVWEAFREVLVRRREDLRQLVEFPVQTNELGRSAALLFGKRVRLGPGIVAGHPRLAL